MLKRRVFAKHIELRKQGHFLSRKVIWQKIVAEETAIFSEEYVRRKAESLNMRLGER
jgi:hypothetical protein